MSFRSSMPEELRASLRLPLKEIPPKYFYDPVGSDLFEQITTLPEYYLTRVERSLLESHSAGLLERVQAAELIELGSGYSVKTRLLLDAMKATGRLRRYVPFDISEAAIAESVRRVGSRYPGIAIRAVTGDFERDLTELPAGRQRLVAFLGSTIGNFLPDRAEVFVASLLRRLSAGEAFLLGVDLVKDPAILHAAYNDARGVTAEFNRNILRVVNRELGASFAPEEFEHVAFYDAENRWIEMRLRAERPMSIRIPGLDARDRPPFVLELARGEEIRTEISRKFTRPDVEALFAAADAELTEWITDPEGWFALALATPRAR